MAPTASRRPGVIEHTCCRWRTATVESSVTTDKLNVSRHPFYSLLPVGADGGKGKLAADKNRLLQVAKMLMWWPAGSTKGYHVTLPLDTWKSLAQKAWPEWAEIQIYWGGSCVANGITAPRMPLCNLILMPAVKKHQTEVAPARQWLADGSAMLARACNRKLWKEQIGPWGNRSIEVRLSAATIVDSIQFWKLQL